MPIMRKLLALAAMSWEKRQKLNNVSSPDSIHIAPLPNIKHNLDTLFPYVKHFKKWSSNPFAKFGGKTINAYLRHIHDDKHEMGRELDGEKETAIRRCVDRIDKMFIKHRSEHAGGKVYRHSGQEPEHFVVGHTYTNHGYTSTVPNKEISDNYLDESLKNNKVRFHLTVPPNHPILNIRNIDDSKSHSPVGGFKEHLLPRQTKYRVTKIVPRESHTEIHADVLPYEHPSLLNPAKFQQNKE